MKLPRRRFLHLAAGAAALPALSRGASAQAYPSRPVRSEPKSATLAKKSNCRVIRRHCAPRPSDSWRYRVGVGSVGRLVHTSGLSWSCLPFDPGDAELERQLRPSRSGGAGRRGECLFERHHGRNCGAGRAELSRRERSAVPLTP
jgi:hypothetical protein